MGWHLRIRHQEPSGRFRRRNKRGAISRTASSPRVGAGCFKEAAGGTAGWQERQAHGLGRPLRDGLMALMAVEVGRVGSTAIGAL